jgi:hypothetical protein
MVEHMYGYERLQAWNRDGKESDEILKTWLCVMRT